MGSRQGRKDEERQSNRGSPVFASHVPLADPTIEEPERRVNSPQFFGGVERTREAALNPKEAALGQLGSSPITTRLRCR